VYYFLNGGEEELYCASADWMERNFFRRVEVAFPIERRKHRERILRDLATYLADNTQAWELRADGSYLRVPVEGAEPLSAQQRLLQEYAAPGQFSA
jgi:polyphosphate kinase